MNEAHIEKAATDLLIQIYRDRRYLWPDQDTPPMMMRSPRIAALVCGYDYHVQETHSSIGTTPALASLAQVDEGFAMGCRQTQHYAEVEKPDVP